ncbi:MAG: hypothetical protein ACAI35_26240 [Candidatus Methylacidiphilales bacterium]|nr:hypothetical protein [Candidatus Methylacidiphilales bacterium]
MKTLRLKNVATAFCWGLLMSLVVLHASSDDDKYQYKDTFGRVKDLAEPEAQKHYILTALNLRCTSAGESLDKELARADKTYVSAYVKAYLAACVEFTTFIDQSGPVIPENMQKTVAIARFWADFSKVKYSSDGAKYAKNLKGFMDAHYEDFLKIYKERSAK